MSRRRLQAAGAALRLGDARTASQLLDVKLLASAETPEAAAHLRLAQAVAQLRRGDAQAAAAILGGVDPQHPELAFSHIAAAALLGANRTQDALPHLARLAQANLPGARARYQDALILLGTQALSLSNSALAVQLLETAVSAPIENSAHRRTAWLGLLRGYAAAARPDLLERVFTLCPELAADQQARWLAARAAALRLELECFDRHLRVLGASSAAWGLQWLLCVRLFAAARYQEVVHRFQGVVSSPKLDPAGRAMVVLAALSAQALGQPTRGRQLLEQLTSQHPQEPELRYYAALFAHAVGDRAGLQHHLAALGDRSELGLMLRWCSPFVAGEHQALREALTPAAVARLPQGVEREVVRLMAAVSCALLRDGEQAAALLKEARSEELPAALRPSLRHLRGYLALQRGQYREAAALLPQGRLNMQAQLELCREQADGGDLPGALAAVEKISGHGLGAAVTKTSSQLRLALAQEAAVAGSHGRALQLISDLETQSPELAVAVARLRDHIVILRALQLEEGSAAEAASRLWALSSAPPAGLDGERMRRRRHDLVVLAAVRWLRGTGGKGGRTLELTAPLQALEAAYEMNQQSLPAVALLGFLLWYTGHKQRAFPLLELARRRGLASPALERAIVLSYLELGRVLDAKQIAFRQLCDAPRDRRAARQLGLILSAEFAAATFPVGDEAEVPEQLVEAPEAVELFPGTEPLQRLPMLLWHLERRLSGLPAELQSHAMALARELKRLAVAGNASKIAETEQQALTLLQGGIP